MNEQAKTLKQAGDALFAATTRIRTDSSKDAFAAYDKACEEYERLSKEIEEASSHPVDIGRRNFQMVREYFEAHLCATQRECSAALGLGHMAVHRHVQKIRSEWKGNDHD